MINFHLQTENECKKLRGNERVPLAEQMRPTSLLNFVGQKHILGPRTMLSELLQKGEIPNMILWGPPGCGKVLLPYYLSVLGIFYVNACWNVHCDILFLSFCRHLWLMS